MTELENMLAEARLLITALHASGVIQGDEDGREVLGEVLVDWSYWPGDTQERMVQFLSGFDDRNVPASWFTLTYDLHGKVVKDLQAAGPIQGDTFQWLMWLTAFNRANRMTPDLLPLMEGA